MSKQVPSRAVLVIDEQQRRGKAGDAFKEARARLYSMERSLSRYTMAERRKAVGEFLAAAREARASGYLVSDGNLSAVKRVLGVGQTANTDQIMAALTGAKPSTLTAKDIDRAQTRAMLARLRARTPAQVAESYRKLRVGADTEAIARAADYVPNPNDDTQVSWVTCSACQWIYPERKDGRRCPVCGAQVFGELYWGPPPDAQYDEDLEQAQRNFQNRPDAPGVNPDARTRRAGASRSPAVSSEARCKCVDCGQWHRAPKYHGDPNGKCRNPRCAGKSKSAGPAPSVSDDYSYSLIRG